MQGLRILRALGANDYRNIQRDALLRWMIVVPILYAVAVRLLVPLIEDSTGFDLAPYYPAIMGFFALLTCPILFGMVVGFLLLDERDDRTLLAMQVSPLPMGNYLAYKLFVPSVLSMLMTVIVYAIPGLLPVDLNIIVPGALIAALEMPIWALLLMAFANNKVEGFALLKGGAGALLVLPLAAYFVDYPWQALAWILPSYWPVKVYWLAIERAGYWPYLIAGLAYHALLIVLLLRRFRWKLSRAGD